MLALQAKRWASKPENGVADRLIIGQVDVIGPASADDAFENGWPTTLEDAAKGTRNAGPLFPKESHGDLTIDTYATTSIQRCTHEPADSALILDG